MQPVGGVTVGNEVVRGDESALVGGGDILDAAVLDVLGPDGEDVDAAAVGAGYRAAVEGALPVGVRLRGLAFSGPTPTPAHAVAVIRAAFSDGGVVDVVAHLASDALAARLLRAAVRRTEASNSPQPSMEYVRFALDGRSSGFLPAVVWSTELAPMFEQ